MGIVNWLRAYWEHIRSCFFHRVTVIFFIFISTFTNNACQIWIPFRNFWTILFRYKKCITEKRTYGFKLLNSYLLTVLLSIPLNKTSWVWHISLFFTWTRIPEHPMSQVLNFLSMTSWHNQSRYVLRNGKGCVIVKWNVPLEIKVVYYVDLEYVVHHIDY